MVCGNGLCASVADLLVGEESSVGLSLSFSICVALFSRNFGLTFKFVAMDLIGVFALGVVAASSPLSRHVIVAALPWVGAAVVIFKSQCRRVARAVVKTTTSFEPETPIVLPKIKRPGFQAKHETIVRDVVSLRENVSSNVSAENVENVPTEVLWQTVSNANLSLDSSEPKVVVKQTVTTSEVGIHDRKQRSWIDEERPLEVSRPTGIAEDLLHQDEESRDDDNLPKPESVSLDILVQRKNFGEPS